MANENRRHLLKGGSQENHVQVTITLAGGTTINVKGDYAQVITG